MITFKKLDEGDLEQVLEWRTSEHVTRYMYSDIDKNLDNQMKWYKAISKDDTQYYWIIEYKGTAIGLMSINNLDRNNRKATFGYYLGDLSYTMIAGRIHPYFYNFAFFQLGLNKLYAEVMDGNDGMMKMHLHHGFKHVATFKEHIYKYGYYHDVHYFELLASTWKENCQKFHRFAAQFTL
ncbi:UDP-4-amino-4,6-dideoxy-N-acetyl-beta-L-altrosamine N-acetyltransferase [Paenibacillus sp. TH7-28]